MALDWSKLEKQKNSLEEKLSKNSGPRAKFWRPNPGQNKCRVMPGWTDKGAFAGQFWREVSQHWNVSPEQRGPVLCPKATPGLSGKCPICDFYEELKKDKSNPDAQATAKVIRPKATYLLNVVDLTDAEYTAKDVAEYKQARPDGDVPFAAGDVKVQVYACPSTVFNQLLGAIQVNNTDITDADVGHDIIISKTGTGLTTRYEVQVMMKPTAAPPVEVLPALEDVGYEMPEEDMHALLAQGVGADYVGLLSKGKPKALPADAEPDDVAEDEADAAEDLRRSMLEAASD